MPRISVMQMLMITLASTANAELTRQVSVARVLSNFPESWVLMVALAHAEQLIKNTAADAVSNLRVNSLEQQRVAITQNVLQHHT